MRSVLWIGIMAVTGCGDTEGPTTTVSGVVSVDGIGIADAQLFVSDQAGDRKHEQTTGADGRYSFDVVLQTASIALEPGTIDRADAWNQTSALLTLEGGEQTVDFLGTTDTGACTSPVPLVKLDVDIEDATELTGITACSGSLIVQIPVQWTANEGDEVQLIVSGAGTSGSTNVVLDVGVDNQGNSGAQLFDRSTFASLASQAITGDATSDPATITAPIDVGPDGSVTATVDGTEASLDTLDITVQVGAPSQDPDFIGLLPVDLVALGAALHGE